MIIRNFQVAQSLYLKYSQGKNREALRDIYIQEDDYNSQAAMFITESLEPRVFKLYEVLNIIVLYIIIFYFINAELNNKRHSIASSPRSFQEG